MRIRVLWYLSLFCYLPGLYAVIPVPVLQVPAGEEGGPGGLLNLLKERRMRRMRRRRTRMLMLRKNKGEEEGWGGYSRQPGDERGHDGQIFLGPFCLLSPSPAVPALRFFLPRRG